MDEAQDLLTQQEMIAYIAETFDMKKSSATRLYKSVFGLIESRLKAGGRVKIPNVGVLHRATLEATVIKHPATGEELQVPKRYRYKLSSKPFQAE